MIKTILVPATGSDSDSAVFTSALAIARTFAAHLEFLSGVEEIFDVQVLPGVRFPVLSGPYPNLDGAAPIWTVPLPPPAAKES